MEWASHGRVETLEQSSPGRNLTSRAGQEVLGAAHPRPGKTGAENVTKARSSRAGYVYNG